jgi:hypothetical protein
MPGTLWFLRIKPVSFSIFINAAEMITEKIFGWNECRLHNFLRSLSAVCCEKGLLLRFIENILYQMSSKGRGVFSLTADYLFANVLSPLLFPSSYKSP